MREQQYRVAAEAAAQALATLDRYEGRPAADWKEYTAAQQEEAWRQARSLHEELKVGSAELSDDHRQELKVVVTASVLMILDPDLREVPAEGPRSSKFPDAPHVQLSGPLPDMEPGKIVELDHTTAGPVTDPVSTEPTGTPIK